MKIFRKLFSKKDPTEKKIEANEKALKKRNVKRGVGLAVGGALAAKTTANAIRMSKDDTEEKNNKLKEESKNFSRFCEVSKKVAKTGIKAGKRYVKDFDINDYNNLKSAKDSYIAAKKNNDNKPENNPKKDKLFSGREKVSKENLKEAKKSGVIQKDSDGNWRIISLKAGEYWDAKYETREKAEAALAAYHANRH